MCPHTIPSPRHVYTHSPTTRPPIHASVCPSVSAFVASRTCSMSSKGQQAHPAPQCHAVLIPGKSSLIPPCPSCHASEATGELVSPSSMWFWWSITFSSQLCPSEGRSSQPWRRCLQKGRWLGGTSLFLSPLTREA